MESVPKISSALIDNSVFQRLNLVEGALDIRSISWGDQQHKLPVAGYQRKRLRQGEDVWLRDEINALPTIIKLTQESRLRLCTYSEIRHEALRGSAGLVNTKGHLGNSLRLDEIQSAVDRSFFQKMQLSEFIKKETFIEFCKVLNTGHLRELEQQVPDYWAKLPDLTKTSLKAIERFQQLLACLPEAHYRDVFHLWTAEVNGLDFFLVLDNKFIRALTESTKIELPTLPALPTTMLQKMGVKGRVPLPIDDDRFYHRFE